MSEPFVGQIMPVGFNFAPINWLTCQGQSLNINQYQAMFALLGVSFGGNGSTTFGLPNLAGRMAIGTGNNAIPQAPHVYQHGETGGAPVTTLTLNQLPAHNHSAAFVPTTSGAGAPAASGNVSLPLTANISNLPVNVSSATLGASTAAGAVNSPSGANLQLAAPPPIPISGSVTQPVKLYGPAGSSPVQLANPLTINATVSGSVSGTAGGNVSLPITGGMLTGGSVTIGNNGSGQAFSIMPPFVAINTIIAAVGVFPSRQ